MNKAQLRQQTPVQKASHTSLILVNVMEPSSMGEELQEQRHTQRVSAREVILHLSMIWRPTTSSTTSGMAMYHSELTLEEFMSMEPGAGVMDLPGTLNIGGKETPLIHTTRSTMRSTK